MRSALPGLLLLATGCVAMPVALPPVQLQVGTGMRSLAVGEPDPKAPTGLDVPMQVRAGVHPLALFPSLITRRGDFGVGYLFDYGADATLNGAWLEGSVHLLHHALGPGFGRLGVRGQARLLHADPVHAWGGAGALQLGWDYVTFVDGEVNSHNEDGGAFGRDYGEGGAGFYLEGSYLRAGELHGFTLTAGLTVHVPAFYGIAYAWIWSLL